LFQEGQEALAQAGSGGHVSLPEVGLLPDEDAEASELSVEDGVAHL
jgi:hypothetical protein